MSRFAGKAVVVTGGASGIGEATVRRFIEDGAGVAFADRNAERGQAVAAELESHGAAVHFVEADMGEEAQAAGFIETAVARLGRLDVLVNNAGIRNYQAVTEASKESWTRCWRSTSCPTRCARAPRYPSWPPPGVAPSSTSRRSAP